MSQEIETKLEVVRINRACGCGNGELRSTGSSTASIPPKYEHHCKACGATVEFVDKQYPHLDFRPLGIGTVRRSSVADPKPEPECDCPDPQHIFKDPHTRRGMCHDCGLPARNPCGVNSELCSCLSSQRPVVRNRKGEWVCKACMKPLSPAPTRVLVELTDR